MLGESGRTMSNRDLLGESGRTMSGIDRAIAAGMGSPMMSDNEPRMEDRDQVFSIEAEIQNLMKSYNMLVEAQEFDRAQQVANMIDQLQHQKIGVQAQNVPQEDEISRILDSISI
jgi:hypothetical protein